MTTTAAAAPTGGRTIYQTLNDRLVANGGPIADAINHRADGGYATYRDYGVRDWLKGTEPTYSGDHGRQVRTGSTPRIKWDETRQLIVTGEHAKGIASYQDALTAAAAISSPSGPDGDQVRVFGAVLDDGDDTFRVVSAALDPSTSSRAVFVPTYLDDLVKQVAGLPHSHPGRLTLSPVGSTLRALVANGPHIPAIFEFAAKVV